MDTSLMFGIFSSMQGPSARITAGIMATTAFFAPLIVTSPSRRRPPFIINFSKTQLSCKTADNVRRKSAAVLTLLQQTKPPMIFSINYYITNETKLKVFSTEHFDGNYG